MKKLIILLLANVLLLTNLSAQTNNRRPMTLDDGFNLVRVGEVQPDETGFTEETIMSPDGELVFYTTGKPDFDNNGYIRNYYMISSQGGEPTQFIGSAGGRDFKFSPDGSSLSLIRENDSEQHIYLIPVPGGEAVQLTHLKGGVRQISLWSGERLTYTSYKWSPDGSAIYFIAEEPPLYESQDDWYGADPVFVDEGPNGKSLGRWSNLWKYDFETQSEKKITDEEFIIQDFDVSPDGNRVILSIRKDNRTNYPFLSELYLVNAQNRELTRLTNNEAPEDTPRWSPDGKSIAYYAPDDKVYELTTGYIWIMNVDTKESRKLTGQNTGVIDMLTWAPDGKSVVFNEAHRTNVNLFRLNIGKDEQTQLTHATGYLKAESFSSDHSRMVYSFSDASNPTDLYVSDLNGNNPIRITDTNPWVRKELKLAKSQIIRWKSTEDWEIEGMLHLPADYQEGTKIPLLVYIHGGPNAAWPNVFEQYPHIYAGLGYASLRPNIRGGIGYGDELFRALLRDAGGGEYDDVMTGVDHVIDMGIADPERLGVRGWSWGGVLGSWIITQTDRFKAASLGAMVTSWTAETGPGYNFDLSLWYIGGTHWDNPEEWRAHSSLTYIKNVTTPTLVLHGAFDVTSSYNQSLIFFTALRDRGVPTRLIKFPRQAHEISEPKLFRVKDIEEIKWFAKYILGEQWKPWKRKAN